jgi:hypothetical protein
VVEDGRAGEDDEAQERAVVALAVRRGVDDQGLVDLAKPSTTV